MPRTTLRTGRAAATANVVSVFTVVVVFAVLAGACSTRTDSLTEPTRTADNTIPQVAVAPPTAPPTTTPETTQVTTTVPDTTIPAPTTSLYATWSDVVDAQSDGVYRIHAPSCAGDATSTGTGFLIAPGILATAAHVLDGGYNFTVDRDVGETRLTATPIAVNVAEDVALLSVPMATGHLFTLSDTEPRSGGGVGLIGYSRGYAPSRPTRGDVGQLDLDILAYGEDARYQPTRAFQHDAPTNGGDSGGPIIDTQTGHVLGVNVAEASGDNDGLAYAVYLEPLRSLFTQPAGAIPDTCDLAAPTTTSPVTIPPTTIPPVTVATTTIPPVAPPTTVTAGPLTYRVQLGDTVFGIARAFNTTGAAVLAVNDPAIATILPDQALIRLPAAARPINAGDVETLRYTVQTGDSIIAIAKQTGTTPAQLLALNNRLATPNTLAVGEILLIPQF